MKKCLYCKKEMKPSGYSHQLFCKENPDRRDLSGKNNPMYGKKGSNQYGEDFKMTDEVRFKIGQANKGRKLSDEGREKLSSSMKKAHQEGRAWNIGRSRWNNESSYPEKFFMEVIQNEFLDKKYEKEFPLGRYSLDFAWPDKKKSIEIDGEQHERFEEYKNRDIKKDLLCKELGWETLRIKWKDLFNDTKNQIRIAKEFIGS